MAFLEDLRKQCRQRGISLRESQQRALGVYLDTLERWNQVINLTSLEGAPLVGHLVVEPLWVAQQLQPIGRYMDVGSGNGSPSIPWHVSRAFSSVDLVESHQRRAVFLEQAVAKAGLGRVRVHASRVEQLRGVEPVDWISLQGIRLTRGLYDRLAVFGRAGSRLVWLTSRADPPLTPSARLDIPDSGRCAYVFRLGVRTSFGPE